MYKRLLLPVTRSARCYSLVPIAQILETPVTYSSIEQIIPKFVKLSIDEQDSLIASNPKLVNIQLQLLLYSEPSTTKIFKFILNNTKNVYVELVETFLYNLLVSNNLRAATVLLHKLLEDNKQFQLSNESWSHYMDLVCRNVDYLGAMLIFHELIDNVKFYEETTYLVQTNNLLPFLINTSTLEALATIFKNNNDPARIEGIIQYFRRFYSYHQYQYTYKTLLVLRVECYANMNDLNESLKSFTVLAFAHNQSKVQGKKAMVAIGENVQIRNDNIKDNLNSIVNFESKYNLDVHQILLANICKTSLFNPLMHRNVYSSDKFGGYTPVINGSLFKDELPNFEKMITDQISNMEMREILHLTKNSHVLIHIFIVSALCNLGKCDMAILYLKTLPHIFPHKPTKHLIKNQDFMRILESTDDVIVANEVLNFCKSIQDGHADSSILKAYIHVLLSSDKTSFTDIEPSLNLLEKSKNNVLSLSKEQYEILQKITNNSNNSYKFIRVHS